MAMMLSELDGYLAGVLICPEMILPSEWLPAIWSGDGEGAPVFESPREMESLVDLIMQHYNAIIHDLQRGADRYAPIFDVDLRLDDVLWEFWIGGFEQAMALRPESWLSVVASGDEDAASALAGLMALIDLSHGEAPDPPAGEPLNDLAEEAPDLISSWWRRCTLGGSARTPAAHAKARHHPMRSTAGKVGRNAPCPCGSGKKYKKCCGLN